MEGRSGVWKTETGEEEVGIEEEGEKRRYRKKRGGVWGGDREEKGRKE